MQPRQDPTARQGLDRPLLDADLTPYQVLATGTRVAGECIERHFTRSDVVGVIEIGARADLVLLPENPLQSLDAYRSPDGVMAAGR